MAEFDMSFDLSDSDLWVDPELCLSERQASRAKEFRDWLRGTQLAIAAELADPPGQGSMSEFNSRQMAQLERLILEEASSMSAAQIDCQILSKLVSRFNATGYSLPQPRTLLLFSLPRSPFSGKVCGSDDLSFALRCIEEWKSTEKNWIREWRNSALTDKSALTSPPPPLELVVLSAILHGGVLHRGAVVALARALRDPEKHTGLVGNQVYVSLSASGSAQSEMEFRCWRPDVQTACMIQEGLVPGLNWDAAEPDTVIAKRLFGGILTRMKTTGMHAAWRPKSLNHLLETVALCARAEIPAVLVDYAAHTFPSHSVKPAVLQRIYWQVSGRPEAEAITPGESYVEKSVITDLQGNPEESEPEGLRELRKCLRNSTSSTAIADLGKLIDRYGGKQTAWSVITQFAEYLLSRRQTIQPGSFAKKAAVSVSTARAFAVNIVGRHLGQALGGDSPAILDSTALETLYAEVLENLPGGEQTRKQRLARSALRDFHTFLVLEHGSEPLRDNDILGAVRGLLPVDATVITLEEYQSARRSLSTDIKKGDPEEFRDVAEAMLILGFRCGTRRLEALQLKFSDLPEDASWLFLRPSSERNLKTPNATRQLPLHCLLTPDERSVLSRWQQHRAKEGARGDEFLFAVPNRNYPVLPENIVMPIVHGALRDATGDPSIHFHHLRHSFATWTFLRLMLSDLPEVPRLYPHLSETTKWLEASREFRSDLYGHDDQTRRHPRAIASLLGHCGPRISFEHYIHCLDWLLPAFLHRSPLLGGHKSADLIEIGAVASSTAYEWSVRKGGGAEFSELDRLQAISAELYRRRFPNRAQACGSKPQCGKSSGAPQANAPTIMDYWDLLYLRGISNQPLCDLADRFRIDLPLAEAAIDRARIIREIREERGNQIKRHTMEFWTADHRRLDSTKEIDCPSRPRVVDLGKIRQYESSLQTALAQDTGKIRRILGYYTHNVWATETTLPFRDPDDPVDAQGYVRFLQAMGFHRKTGAIRFILFDMGPESPEKRKWTKHLGMKRDRVNQFVFRDPPFQETLASKRWAAIEPALDGEASTGFRFFMVMSAIVYGFENPSSAENSSGLSSG
jgi:integrase